jgi:hypothetical protein
MLFDAARWSLQHQGDSYQSLISFQFFFLSVLQVFPSDSIPSERTMQFPVRDARKRVLGEVFRVKHQLPCNTNQ